MKKIITLMIAATMAGCASTKVSSFDKEKNTVSIEVKTMGNVSNTRAQKNAQKEAEEYCGGQAKLLSMGEKDSGVAYREKSWFTEQGEEKQSNRVFIFACK